jgi:hypothetical protein
MSAKHSVDDASQDGMNSWRGLHPGMVACYRDKASHAKWRWGRKLGARRARRRLGKEIIAEALEGIEQ